MLRLYNSPRNKLYDLVYLYFKHTKSSFQQGEHNSWGPWNERLGEGIIKIVLGNLSKARNKNNITENLNSDFENLYPEVKTYILIGKPI
jgi:uncharacterized protein YwgA